MALASSQIYVATYEAPSDRYRTKSNAPARGPELPPISRWRFGRSSTNLRESASDSRSSSSTGRSGSIRRAVSPNPSVPKPEKSSAPKLQKSSAPKLEKAPSKMSLFSLFSRPKVETARGHVEVGLAVPMQPQTPPKPTPQVSAPKSSLRHNPPPPAQQSVRSRSSQMFRPMSMRPSAPSKEFGNWEPPPLFQAFPQSVKHATVQACIFAPEVLMRTQSQRRQAEMMRERMDSTRDLSVISEDGSEAKRLEKTHKRLISNSVLNPPAPELVNKIYILVTAGYVLQYAGEGSFDRSPEKVLKLGKESAAFACDLIPGKHWVLQISSHASDDGSIDAGPKNSLISRLRSQNNAVRRSAASFLLVLESAEEMDAWMTVVRKEIDNQGGMKAKDDSSRASSSTDDTRDTKSSDTTSHRYHVQRDPKVPSKIGPVDSPLQSQYSSPQIVTSEWDSSRSDRTESIAESSSGQSYPYGSQRQSTEASSLATTPVSVDQVQLDSLRGRSRFSFMSSATSLSGHGTRNTSRESSPGPQSPLKESPPALEAEPRSAMSLKSFHMNPNNSIASRRRSMQPLPVTNENFAPVDIELPPRQRHSLFGPASPKMTDVERPAAMRDISPIAAPSFVPLESGPESPITREIPIAPIARPTRPHVRTNLSSEVLATTRERSPSLSSTGTRSHSNPPRRDLVSPPPKAPAPIPPPSTNRQSVMSNSPVLPMRLSMSSSTLAEARTQRRLSAAPKPFLRPFPVRPQQQHTESNRRMSSMAPTSAPFQLHMNPMRSVTAPVRPLQTEQPTTHPRRMSSMAPTSAPFQLHMNPSRSASTRSPTSPTFPSSMHSASSSIQSLRRQSVQGRTSPAPFLLNSNRPVRAISSTPSFLPGKRTSGTIIPSPTKVESSTSPEPEPEAEQQPNIGRRRSPSAATRFPSLPQDQHRKRSPSESPAPSAGRRRSESTLALPPPLPPPNMPLPTLPVNVATQKGPLGTPPLLSLPPVVALPCLPGMPPTRGLPLTPPEKASTSSVV